MANILHSNLETDVRMASILDRRLNMLLAAQPAMRRSGAIQFFGSVNGSLSDTHGIRLVGLDGTDQFSATAAEDTDISNTSLTDDSANIAVVRAGLRRDESDLAELTGAGGMDVTPELLAQSMVKESERYFDGTVATAVATASTNVGTSGVDMTHDDFVDGIYQLELNSVPGPYFSMLHQRQLADWQESLRGEGGALQFQQATAAMLAIKGDNFVGEFLGVGNWVSADVTASGGNREGGMWGFGAIGYKIGIPVIRFGDVIRPASGPLAVEFQRDASAALTEIIGHFYSGVSVIEQDRLVGIVTDQ